MMRIPRSSQLGSLQNGPIKKKKKKRGLVDLINFNEEPFILK